ncbi:MAG TPA: flotillin domain-containing protein [Acidimicrobiales bacterium]|nr:flotillin domain-containing protein [Acidimicrobiales bacterium]
MPSVKRRSPRELDTQVRRPSDAARYQVEQEAQAQKSAQIARAEAERAATIAHAEATAEQARLSGEGERSRRSALAEAEEIEGRARGAAQLAERQALAEAVELEGKAEASAIQTKGEAEANAMQKKADAFDQYGEAAVLDLVVAMLPSLVRAASEPMAAIDRFTVISTDGASQIAKSVATNAERLSEPARRDSVLAVSPGSIRHRRWQRGSSCARRARSCLRWIRVAAVSSR